MVRGVRAHKIVSHALTTLSLHSYGVDTSQASVIQPQEQSKVSGLHCGSGACWWSACNLSMNKLGTLGTTLKRKVYTTNTQQIRQQKSMAKQPKAKFLSRDEVIAQLEDSDYEDSDNFMSGSDEDFSDCDSGEEKDGK